MHTLYFIGDAESGFQKKYKEFNCEKNAHMPKIKEYKNIKLKSNPLTYPVGLGLGGQ